MERGLDETVINLLQSLQQNKFMNYDFNPLQRFHYI